MLYVTHKLCIVTIKRSQENKIETDTEIQNWSYGNVAYFTEEINRLRKRC